MFWLLVYDRIEEVEKKINLIRQQRLKAGARQV
jgi:hypothetical protein